MIADQNVGDSDVSLFHVRGKTENITLSFFISLFFFFVEQGIVHRDLKPVNLFLDSLGRIKIGDIGLATTHGTTRGGMGTEGTDSIANGQPLKMNSSTKESMTGKVGTTLYVAPELGKRSGGRVKYSQKVDLYSLGIIFFEMCYKPFTTSMERVKVLGNLRTVSACLPVHYTHVRTKEICNFPAH